ncbi:group II intron maturase-specific domain-containing protein [Aidingimonas halophila]|uniref:group II intron maturase-specific domain-containing protein n=1 Tax=Aidingimonas halophila TaxID=574349 RepID=UPI00227D7CC9|nr:group II intron maturase-specific domain-containing protein [Aidingimonas halophila]
MIEELTAVMRGWASYFGLVDVKRSLEALDQWIRRRLRCVVWRQWKRPRTRRRKLRALGLEENRAWKSTVNGRGDSPSDSISSQHCDESMSEKTTIGASDSDCRIIANIYR